MTCNARVRPGRHNNLPEGMNAPRSQQLVVASTLPPARFRGG